MRFLKVASVLGLLLAGRVLVQSQTAPTADGLYATFNTSMGSFVCRLNYQEAPRTVANFVGLADGTKAWLDYSTAQVVRKPLYNGLVFHRVAKGFVIQGGSPNGEGTDDPGYRFRDEFHASLRHSKEGILSMANSGPNSNGSQFFVTLASTSHLDNKHSVFGEVVSGIEVVRAIGAVPVVNERPTNAVTINTVVITRIGRLAAGFNAANVTPALPDPVVVGAAISHSLDGLVVHWPGKDGVDYRICYTASFNSWNGHRVGVFTGTYLGAWQESDEYKHHVFFRAFESKID